MAKQRPGFPPDPPFADARGTHCPQRFGNAFANQSAPIKVLPFQGILCIHNVDF